MKQIIYKCLNNECTCKFKASNKDGLRCPKCKYSIVPFNLNPTEEDLSKVQTYKELKPIPIVNPKSWQEFRDVGLLWWINMILHTFGWSIVVDVEKDGSITNAYPARVKFRGFGVDYNSIGYKQVSKYMLDNAEYLEKESRE